jgi:hypothetical protein
MAAPVKGVRKSRLCEKEEKRSPLTKPKNVLLQMEHAPLPGFFLFSFLPSLFIFRRNRSPFVAGCKEYITIVLVFVSALSSPSLFLLTTLLPFSPSHHLPLILIS